MSVAVARGMGGKGRHSLPRTKPSLLTYVSQLMATVGLVLLLCLWWQRGVRCEERGCLIVVCMFVGWWREGREGGKGKIMDKRRQR